MVVPLGHGALAQFPNVAGGVLVPGVHQKIAGRAVYEVHGSAPAVGKRDRGQISGQAGKLNDAVKQRHRPAAFLDRYIVPQRIAARTGQVGHPVGNVRAQRGFLLKIQRAAKLYALCAAGEHGAVGSKISTRSIMPTET